MNTCFMWKNGWASLDAIATNDDNKKPTIMNKSLFILERNAYVNALCEHRCA